ncbi:uncharacterized protein LOC124121602 [Haliotis rufescens]|uniref:uncharacterized protein LOC124121602 n=1 Tax=Haliotis rufescens TaxID=6454 RepID=UPI00201EF26E|nr:uncharacterized protein LOC124121602 [Haliotis rufescens]
MAGALTILRWGNAASLLLVLSWHACTSQNEHLAFQSSCDPANFSTAEAKCLDQGMQLFSIDDLAIGGEFSVEAQEDHTSIWISGRNCSILKLSKFTDVNCSEQHHYLCKRNASVEELPKNGTDKRAIYVPCKATSVSPLSSSTPLPVTTTNTSTTTSSSTGSPGMSNKAIYLIVAVCVCIIVVCVVAAVVIKRCTAKKEENVSLKNVDVIRERDEGVALTENSGNKDDTRM